MKGEDVMKRPNIEELTLEEKIGQLLMPGQYNTIKKYENGRNVMRSDEEMEKMIEHGQFGSFWAQAGMEFDVPNMAGITTGKKPTGAEYRWFLNKVQKSTKIPMLFGTDCARGAGDSFDDGATVSTGYAVGAADDEELTFKLYASVARELKAAGCNWRWSPVVDVCNRFSGISVGRSYSSNIDRMCRLSIAAIHGMQSEGVAAAAKHFPGSDLLEFRDAHIVPVVINSSLEEWEMEQGKVFQRMIDAGVMSIMISHTAFPAVDDSKINGKYIPSTLSSKILQGLLRQKMGFEGVIVTDAIRMAGLASLCSHEELLIRLVNAGNDILLGCDPEIDFDIVCNAVKEGKIPLSRINESCERILDMKNRMGLFDENNEEIDMKSQASITSDLNRQLAEKSITLLYDKNNLLPLSSEKIKKVFVVFSAHMPENLMDLSGLIDEFEKRGATVEVRTGYVPTDEQRYAAENNDLLLYIACIRPHLPMGMPSLYGDVLKTYAFAFLHGKEKSIGVSMGYPYVHYDFMGGAETFINMYTDALENQKAFVRALYGDIQFMGTSPVDTEPKVRTILG